MTGPDERGLDEEEADAPPRALLIAAIVVAAVAVLAILALAAARQGDVPQQPVAIAAVPAPQADDPGCAALVDALPDQLGDFERAETVDPTPAGTAAWQRDTDAEAVIFRCGLDRPVDFVVGTPLQVVDEVQWFRVAEADRTTWYAVDRPLYVALTLPPESGPTPIQQLSETIAEVLPAEPIDPAPPR
ncbi:DUF3515 domain-containing protein [Mycolicibacterium thermoresistibile]